MPKRDMKMLIVGAGQGGVALIGLFLRSGRVDSIVGVVDRDMNAPGIALAQELGIAVSTNFRDFLGIEGLYEIINVTGREDVQLELLESQPAGVEVVGGHSAKMLWDLIDEHEKIENELQESRKTLQRAYDGMDQKVRERTFELKHEMDDRMDAERRVEHLNKVLRAIRSVSQLIIKENNRDHLVQEICNILVETRGYLIAWIALIDETAGEPYVVSAAVDRPVKSAVSLIKSGDYPPCYTETLSDSGLIYFQDVSVSCKKCVLSEEYCGGGRLCIRIEYGEQVYGILVVALPGEYAIDIEEQELFVEMAGDIAYAL
ncbi:MAG: hypothetical protein HN337_00485, partial [Deltaproteobacteria bacterium]|nr:hypothetical protein [Deltaproteobacteria bacterium]